MSEGPPRWAVRAAVLMCLLVALGVFHLYNEGNQPCPPWKHLESQPGGSWCASYF